MASQLNIKSEEARTLALDLARLTGRSMTEVIVEALRTRLDQVRREQAADSERAAARARDFDTVDGLDMLVAQAAAAFAIFFGKDPPRDRDDDLRELLALVQRRRAALEL